MAAKQRRPHARFIVSSRNLEPATLRSGLKVA
jgi:hypothetical protein